MGKARSKAGKGSGWHLQTKRHSKARRTGKAGGQYAKTYSQMSRAERIKYTTNLVQVKTPLPKNNKWVKPKKQDKIPINKKVVYNGKEYVINDFFKGEYKLVRAGEESIWVKPSKIGLNQKDSDGDGVPDHKDCEPFNPKKQDKREIPKDLKPYIRKNPLGLGIANNYQVKTGIHNPPRIVKRIDKVFYKSKFDGMLYFRKK